MKKLLKLGLLVTLGVSLFLSSCAGEDYYVSDQPVEPVYERPVVPYDGAVWIDGEWAWNGGSYAYTHGHWDKPRPGHNYVRGSWAHSNHGYSWRKGHWQ
ncbi:MAG TPA: hypothetical protein VGN20_22560 [Mucilaginibacter sp.]|jgi:hypothetical protein